MKCKNTFLLIIQFFTNLLLFTVVMMISKRLLFLEPTFTLHYILFVSFQLLLIVSTVSWPFFSKIKRNVAFIAVLILSLFAMYIIYSIIILPFEMYVYWIKLIQEQSPGGAISWLFVWGQVFFKCIFSGLLYKKKYIAAFLGIITSQCIMYTILFQHYILYSATTFITAITLFYLFFKNSSNKAPSLMYYPIRIVMIFFVSFLLSLSVPRYGGWLGKIYLLPNIRQFLTDDFPISPIISTVGGTAHGISRSDVGYSNNNARPVFEIFGKNEHPYYIRISAYSHYDQNTWFNASDELEVKDDSIIHFNHNDGYPDLEISLLADYSMNIPHTLETESINIPDVKQRNFQFASLDYGFQIDLPLTGNKTIEIHEKRRTSLEIPVLSTIEEENCLYVPMYIEKQISTIIDIKSLRNRAPNERIATVLEFLSENYEYSLKVPKANSEQDDVIQFLLENKRGFCQHFSSAFILLARLCRIPSRYVTGYYGIIPEDKESVTLTGMSAHSWAEVWLPDIGWKIIEATPPFSLSRSEQLNVILKTLDNSTQKQLSRLLQIQSPKNAGETIFYRYFLSISVAIIFCVIALGTIIVYRKNIVQWNSFKSNEAKIAGFYKFIIKKSDRIAILGPEIVGWRKWASLSGYKWNLSSKEIQLLVEIAYRSFFDHCQSKQEDIDQLKQIKKRVKQSKMST